MNNDMYQIEDTSYKLKEAEGLIGLLQDELAAVKRAHSEVAEEAKHWREETENLKCALRDIRRDNERLTAERDHAICQEYEAKKASDDLKKTETTGCKCHYYYHNNITNNNNNTATVTIDIETCWQPMREQ
ncbi:hypothetical protein Pmar_PMAR011571 [Perkinsus marinus ATCC 50983]|uniref:Uncharacterized protein n=1 Tax=Perkinsus marinus (strain ATCC 50983 / TXsc) TaxID=423536 RepID=C5LC60_PERM5|nr:hypothetical protein Pmar_PMAR011571 [Perkinsus marinus ATCC 50983]EER05543.1 hypothetical protein Pmar_PMAR011571 [Perkinsus marinus ATCC 50983]|eukprot:XP_002773727.1 hypothetical protein Pmar_PMAR011571 [Perkinsus marinus ATCC 50983]